MADEFNINCVENALHDPEIAIVFTLVNVLKFARIKIFVPIDSFIVVVQPTH